MPTPPPSAPAEPLPELPATDAALAIHAGSAAIQRDATGAGLAWAERLSQHAELREDTEAEAAEGLKLAARGVSSSAVEQAGLNRAFATAQGALEARAGMLLHFRRRGITRATFLESVAKVAEAAAAEGEFGPAVRALELFGKASGVLNEQNNHLHLHGVGTDGVGGGLPGRAGAAAAGFDGGGTGVSARPALLAQYSDAQLADLLAAREAREAELVR